MAVAPVAMRGTGVNVAILVIGPGRHCRLIYSMRLLAENAVWCPGRATIRQQQGGDGQIKLNISPDLPPCDSLACSHAVTEHMYEHALQRRPQRASVADLSTLRASWNRARLGRMYSE